MNHNDPLWLRIAEGLDPEKGKRIEELNRIIENAHQSLERLEAYNELLILKGTSDENRRHSLQVNFYDLTGQNMPEGWEPRMEWPGRVFSWEPTTSEWPSPAIPADEANVPADAEVIETVEEVPGISVDEMKNNLLDELNSYPPQLPENAEKRQRIMQELEGLVKTYGGNIGDMLRVASLLRLWNK